MYGGYLLLNVFDLALTSLILSVGGAEANPVTGYFLYSFGAGAFILAKMALVAVAVIACEALRTLRPQAASKVMHAGVFIYFILVMYECSLLIRHLPHAQLMAQLGR